MVIDTNLSDTTYTASFNKEMDDQSKKIVQAYHPQKDAILSSQVESSGIMNYSINTYNEQHVKQSIYVIYLLLKI